MKKFVETTLSSVMGKAEINAFLSTKEGLEYLLAIADNRVLLPCHAIPEEPTPMSVRTAVSLAYSHVKYLKEYEDWCIACMEDVQNQMHCN